MSKNNAMECERFAFISPDDINGTDELFSGFIRSIGSVAQGDYGYSTNNKIVRKSFEDSFNQKQYLYSVGNDIMNANDSYFSDDVIKTFPVEMYRVHPNRLLPDSNGCISRMKGMCEIFGDYPQTNYNIDYINQNLNGHTRSSLSNGGLMLNRLMFINDQDEGSMMAPEIYDIPFSVSIYDKWKTRNGAPRTPLPVIMTNLSMASVGYFYFNCDEPIIDDLLTGVTYAHTINEKYVYNPDAVDIYDTLKGLFEPIGNTYHSIGSVRCIQSPVYPTWSMLIEPAGNYYRGDICSTYCYEA